MFKKILGPVCASLLLGFLVLFSQIGIAVEPVPAQEGAAAIINGSDSPAGGQPWIVALVRKSSGSSSTGTRQFCGGTLIAPTWVLTAAHCVANFDVDAFELVIGREKLDDAGGETIAAAEVMIHPLYAEYQLVTDIALVRLASASSAQTLPIATAVDDTSLVGATLNVYGWGFKTYREEYDCDLNFIDTVTDIGGYWCDTVVYSSGINPADMQEGSVQLFSYANCDNRYREYLLSKNVSPHDEAYFSEELTPQVLCAWDPGVTQSPCFGDSGGPLVGTSDNEPVLLGVVNFGYVSDCGLQGQLGLYARVSYHAAFIADAMGRDQALGFAALCPRQPAPTVTYVPQTPGVVRVTVAWAGDSKALAWRLAYADPAVPGKVIGSIQLPGQQQEFTINLPSGREFNVALQAQSSACDSPVSDMLTVAVP